MKKSLFTLLALPAIMYGQDTLAIKNNNELPNTFSSGSSKIEKFDNKARRFNDWSISVGGGTALMQSADLTSFYDNKINWGWNAYVSLDKQISHTFGLSLQYQQGQTNQKAMLKPEFGVGEAYTKYKQISLLGDINISEMLKRIDNHSNYRWALHGYAGFGLQGYNTHLVDRGIYKTAPLEVTQNLDVASFFFQFGTGLKYKVSKFVDIEARLMYIDSGDDEFDGSGWDQGIRYPYTKINSHMSDKMFTSNLGLSFKLGKHLTHLAWHDPLQESFYRIYTLENIEPNQLICKNGDQDDDGVCDDWDRQLDTPKGARVDGAGVALDIDLDGVIDLYDECVTVPGPVENNGCPYEEVVVKTPKVTSSITEINQNFEGIEFALNSDVIRPKSFDKLDRAADLIKTLDNTKQYLVIGATDTRGSDAYNLKLSQKRANAVVKYLNDRGVPMNLLIPEGRGEKDLKYPECEPATVCPEWKNEANRRVYFSEK